MEPANGEPFLEHEKRYLITEALKASTIPIERLFNLLQEVGAPPKWDDMLLPRGRTLNQCKAAYESLRSSHLVTATAPPRPHPVHPPFSAPTPPPIQNVQKRKSDFVTLGQPYIPGEPSAKRRQSGTETMVGARDIRPKPPNGGSPVSMASTPTASAQKRRGRPPKSEVERRNQDAMRRGEVFPGYLPSTEEFATSPYAAIAPTPPSLAPGPPTPQGFIEQNLPETQADSPGKKNRRKPAPKPKAAPPRQPGESSFSVNPQLPIVREPDVRPPGPTIATITEMQQTGVAAPPPILSASVIPSPQPTIIEAATTAETQPPAQAAS